MERFEKNIQEKLRDFQVQPPEEVWGAIENQLVQKQGKKFLWLRIAAAILLLVVSITSLVLYLPQVRIAEPLAVMHISEDDFVPIYMVPSDTETKVEIISDLKEITESDVIYELEKTEIYAAVSMYTDETPGIDSDMFTDYSNISGLAELNPIKYESQLTYELSFSDGVQSSSIIALKGSDKDYFEDTETKLPSIEIIKTSDQSQRVFALSAYLAPQQSFRYQRNTTPISFEKLESEIFSFGAGIRFHYKLNSRWEVESGLGYNMIGQAVNGITAFSHPSMIPLYSSRGEVISSHPQSMRTSMGGIVFKNQSFYFADIASTRVDALKGSYDESNVNLLNKTATGLIQHFGYIEVPLVLRYKIIDRMLSLSVKSGISANFLYTSNVYLQGSAFSRPIGESTGISPLSWSGTGGLSLEYPISNRINIALDPTFTMFLTPMGQYRNLIRETYPYNYSLYMGIRYNL